MNYTPNLQNMVVVPPNLLDSGCSRHMTWDINNFTTLSRYMEGGSVTFGDDSKGTIGMGLWYPKTGEFSMTSFLDADYAGCRVDRKSTSGTC